MAKFVIDNRLQTNPPEKKAALIVDVDETVLDNSPFQAKAIELYKGYPNGWDEWCNLSQAEAVPGAIDFLNYAVSQGVDVFYVTNRKSHLKAGTLKNLQDLGFPQADTVHLQHRTDVRSKEPRRQTIGQTHEIILLMGDNLNDFSDAFSGKSVADRAKEVDQLKDEFGTKFIVLPNAIYGDWEGAIYNHEWPRADEEKIGKRKAALRSY